MENVPIWHYRSPNKDEYAQALARAGERRHEKHVFRDAVRGGDGRTRTSTSSSPTSRRPAAWQSSRSEYPERFINVGVAEQSMIGICAGLALKGCQPFAYTIATFIALSSVRDGARRSLLPEPAGDRRRHGRRRDLFDAGRHASHAGRHRDRLRAAQHAGHRALRSRSNASRPTRWCATAEERAGLSAHRQGRRARLTAQAEPWQFGKLRYLRRGSDVCILTYGVITKMAAEIADKLAAQGTLGLAGLGAHAEAARPRGHRRRVATAQAGRRDRGTRAAGRARPQTKQIAWDVRATCRLDTFTLQDEFIHNYGSTRRSARGARSVARADPGRDRLRADDARARDRRLRLLGQRGGAPARERRPRLVGTYRRDTDFLAPLRDVPRLDLVRTDLIDAGSLHGPFDAIVHTAATSPGPGVDVATLVRDNIDASSALIEAARRWRTNRFIFFSSLSYYGRIEQDVVDEATPVRDPDAYGATKLIVEQRLAELPGEFSTLALRLPGIIGPGRIGIGSQASRHGCAPANRSAPSISTAPSTTQPISTIGGARRNRADARGLGRLRRRSAWRRGILTVRETIERLARALGVPANIEETPRPARRSRSRARTRSRATVTSRRRSAR